MNDVVSLDELLPDCDAANAQLFCQHMYQGRLGYVVLTQISATGRHIVRSYGLESGTLISSLGEEGNNLSALTANDGGRWNVYVSCAMHSKDPTEGGKKRGGKQTIERVHEVRLDLDLKEESFKTSQDIDEFIARFPVRPTLIVDSGIGAKHCYWILEHDVDRDEGERLNRAWWAMAQEMAGPEVFIDHVHTADRIMRLPGTIRWPKLEGERAARVRLIGGHGERVAQEDLWQASEAAFYRAEANRSEVRRRAETDMSDAKMLLEDVQELTGWTRDIAFMSVDDIFNSSTSWDQILIPHGWQVWKQDYEGRRHWVRPGKTQGTSATTDFPSSPHVMTLFSNAADSRLVNLAEAEVPLTKFRVYAELNYGGDVAELARIVVQGLKGEAR
jgi:hypothetical protein